MYFVGIDLAWGQLRPTGLAVLDDAGRLVHVSAAGTDDEIATALAPYLADQEPDSVSATAPTPAGPTPAVVAIDAPLIVRNATGNRPAEAALNRDFARFDAGAHPVNTGKKEFSIEPRAARISRRLGLDITPSGAPAGGIGSATDHARRAIEVYPHAATVALFRLGRTLKYKNKKGRDLDGLRQQLQLLMTLIEGLRDAAPALVVQPSTAAGWAELVSAVAGAERKSELRVVEDQVDAVMCSYVALFATRAADRTTAYGDAETGFIVTPTLPADLEPTPRVRPAVDVVVDVVGEGTRRPVLNAVREYTAVREELAQAGRQSLALITGILDEAGINYLSVTGRIKTVESFAAKAARRQPDGRPVYPDPLRDVTDQIGVRVITYVQGDVIAVADLLHDQIVVTQDRDLGQATARDGRFGYASRHLLTALDAAREGQPEFDHLAGRPISVQVRTVLQHAWAEFEHDIRYKGTVPAEHASEFDRRFSLAAGLLELADREFSSIQERLQAGSATPTSQSDDDPRIDPRELAAFLAGQYADAGWSRTDHYAWISGLLLELGITSLAELSDVLRPANDLNLNGRMAYKYPPGAVRRLDDALLAAFADDYVGLSGNEHRRALLHSRLDKLLGPEPD